MKAVLKPGFPGRCSLARFRAGDGKSGLQQGQKSFA